MSSLSSSLVIGREAELARLESGLARVPCALILGLAGVGKSAVARRFVAQGRWPVLVQHAREGTSLDELVDDARRQLAGGGAAGARVRASEAARFAELAERLDEGGALWLIEDADRVEGIDRLLTALAERLARGRLVATARGRIFAAERGPERVELVLDGLREEEARSLWHHLDELYGAAEGFAAAWRLSRGNPFQLRQAHAGVIDAEDPAAAAISTLAEEPRQLALALALSAEPLPRSALDALSAGGSGAALRVLVARLIVEPAGQGRFAVHDLLRGALVRGAAGGELRRAHVELARALEQLPVPPIGAPGERDEPGEPGERSARDPAAMDPVKCLRERARHLLGAGDRAAARALILASASALIRAGAAAELQRCLEALGEAGDLEVQLARARTWIRMLELHRAYDQMLAVSRAAGAPAGVALEAQVSLAHLSMLTCRLEQAVQLGRAAQRARGLPLPLRVRLVTVEVLARTAMGEGDAARAGVDAEGPAEVREELRGEAPAVLRAYLLFTRAFSFWLEERDAEAEVEMRTAWALCKDVLSFRARVLAPLFFASVLARNGRGAESQRVLAEVESDVAGFDDPLVQVSQRAIRITLLECEGSFEAALQLAADVEATYLQAGVTLGALWVRLHRGRLLLLTGRLRAGRALLDELVRSAGEVGARMLVRLARDAQRADPLAALAHGPSPSARPGEVRRGRALAAVTAVLEGQLEIARGYAVALQGEPRIDPLSAALVQLAAAALEPEAAARAALTQAALEQAAAGGADPELLPAVAARLGLVGEQRVIWIDTVNHEVRSEAGVIALARRPSVRRLLYTLAADPGRAHDKESIARGIWNASYHPARHDGALWVNVKRLREVLSGSGLRVDSSDEGYRLRVDDGHILRTA